MTALQSVKKTHMPESAHHKSKWRMTLDFVDLAQRDIVPHRAILADGWYGNIPEFRYGLELRGESYILGVYSNTQVFLENPVFEVAPAKECKRGRLRSRTTIIATNPALIKLSAIGEAVPEDAWQQLELRHSSQDKPLMVEVVSMRV